MEFNIYSGIDVSLFIFDEEKKCSQFTTISLPKLVERHEEIHEDDIAVYMPRIYTDMNPYRNDILKQFLPHDHKDASIFANLFEFIIDVAPVQLDESTFDQLIVSDIYIQRKK